MSSPRRSATPSQRRQSLSAHLPHRDGPSRDAIAYQPLFASAHCSPAPQGSPSPTAFRRSGLRLRQASVGNEQSPSGCSGAGHHPQRRWRSTEGQQRGHHEAPRDEQLGPPGSEAQRPRARVPAESASSPLPPPPPPPSHAQLAPPPSRAVLPVLPASPGAGASSSQDRHAEWSPEDGDAVQGGEGLRGEGRWRATGDAPAGVGGGDARATLCADSPPPTDTPALLPAPAAAQEPGSLRAPVELSGSAQGGGRGTAGRGCTGSASNREAGGDEAPGGSAPSRRKLSRSLSTRPRSSKFSLVGLISRVARLPSSCRLRRSVSPASPEEEVAKGKEEEEGVAARGDTAGPSPSAGEGEGGGWHREGRANEPGGSLEQGPQAASTIAGRQDNMSESEDQGESGSWEGRVEEGTAAAASPSTPARGREGAVSAEPSPARQRQPWSAPGGAQRPEHGTQRPCEDDYAPVQGRGHPWSALRSSDSAYATMGGGRRAAYRAFLNDFASLAQRSAAGPTERTPSEEPSPDAPPPPEQGQLPGSEGPVTSQLSQLQPLEEPPQHRQVAPPQAQLSPPGSPQRLSPHQRPVSQSPSHPLQQPQQQPQAQHRLSPHQRPVSPSPSHLLQQPRPQPPQQQQQQQPYPQYDDNGDSMPPSLQTGAYQLSQQPGRQGQSTSPRGGAPLVRAVECESKKRPSSSDSEGASQAVSGAAARPAKEAAESERRLTAAVEEAESLRARVQALERSNAELKAEAECATGARRAQDVAREIRAHAVAVRKDEESREVQRQAEAFRRQVAERVQQACAAARCSVEQAQHECESLRAQLREAEEARDRDRTALLEANERWRQFRAATATAVLCACVEQQQGLWRRRGEQSGVEHARQSGDAPSVAAVVRELQRWLSHTTLPHCAASAASSPPPRRRVYSVTFQARPFGIGFGVESGRGGPALLEVVGAGPAAARRGVSVGDVLIAVGGRPLPAATVDAAQRALANAPLPTALTFAPRSALPGGRSAGTQGPAAPGAADGSSLAYALVACWPKLPRAIRDALQPPDELEPELNRPAASVAAATQTGPPPGSGVSSAFRRTATTGVGIQRGGIATETATQVASARAKLQLQRARDALQSTSTRLRDTLSASVAAEAGGTGAWRGRRRETEGAPREYAPAGGEEAPVAGGTEADLGTALRPRAVRHQGQRLAAMTELARARGDALSEAQEAVVALQRSAAAAREEACDAEGRAEEARRRLRAVRVEAGRERAQMREMLAVVAHSRVDPRFGPQQPASHAAPDTSAGAGDSPPTPAAARLRSVQGRVAALLAAADQANAEAEGRAPIRGEGATAVEGGGWRGWGPAPQEEGAPVQCPPGVGGEREATDKPEGVGSGGGGQGGDEGGYSAGGEGRQSGAVEGRGGTAPVNEGGNAGGEGGGREEGQDHASGPMTFEAVPTDTAARRDSEEQGGTGALASGPSEEEESAELRRELARAREEAAAATAEARESAHRVSRMQRSLDLSAAAGKKLRAARREAEAAAAASQRKVEELQQTADSLRRRVEAAEAARREAEESVEAAQTEAGRAIGREREAEAALAAASAQREAARAEARAAQAELAEARKAAGIGASGAGGAAGDKRVAEERAEAVKRRVVVVAEARAEAAEARREALAGELRERVREGRELEARAQAAESREEALLHRVTVAEHAAREAKGQLAEVEAARRAVEERASALEAEVEAVQGRERNLAVRAEQAETQVREARQYIAELNRPPPPTVEALEQRISRGQEEREAAERAWRLRVEDLERAMSALREERSDAELEAAGLRRRLTALQNAERRAWLREQPGGKAPTPRTPSLPPPDQQLGDAADMANAPSGARSAPLASEVAAAATRRASALEEEVALAKSGHARAVAASVLTDAGGGQPQARAEQCPDTTSPAPRDRAEESPWPPPPPPPPPPRTHQPPGANRRESPGQGQASTKTGEGTGPGEEREDEGWREGRDGQQRDDGEDATTKDGTEAVVEREASATTVGGSGPSSKQ